MKHLTEHLVFDIPSRRAFVNITREVEDAVRRSGVQEGLCLVNAMHISASVFINDDERGLHHDYEVWLERLPEFRLADNAEVTWAGGQVRGPRQVPVVF